MFVFLFGLIGTIIVWSIIGVPILDLFVAATMLNVLLGG